MKISQLKQPYKKLAQFYTLETKKKKPGVTLGNAFNWGTCISFNYTKSHWKFWSDVEDGKSPQIPKAILDHYNKHNPKEAFQVMGMPKPVSEKPKSVTTKQAQSLTNDNQHLVGRKISAFGFESGTNGINYGPRMNDLLGYDGTIVAAYPDAVELSFETRKGTTTVWYPFGKDGKSDLTSRSAESFLIPEEEVQKALANMPAEPFKVGETVYLRGNAGQYKCVIDRIYFTGKPISLDAGKRIVLQNLTIDGRSQPGKPVVLSRTPWRNEYGFILDILNAETETISQEVTIDCDLKSEEIEAGFSLLQTLETVHLFADILKGVHDFTGKISPEDIDYHVSLIERNLSK